MHDSLRINQILMLNLMKQTVGKRSIEYADNRISLFSSQWGKCAITGKEFKNTHEIHCHHIVPKKKGGSDKYANLILVCEEVHKLIHATEEEAIKSYKNTLNLTNKQLEKLNELRVKAGIDKIKVK